MRLIAATGTIALTVVTIACSGTSRTSGFDAEQSTNATDPSNGGSNGGGASGGGGGFGKGDSGAASNPAYCTFMDGTDHDGDGYSYDDGDCNDCDPNANPGAFDVAGNGVDEDCNGKADDEPTGCDAALQVASTDPMDAAKAIGLCRVNADPNATGKDKHWGVLSAKYILPDGNAEKDPRGHALLLALGVNAPQDGMAMLSLSSGNANNNAPSAMDLDKGYTSGAPAGYPKDTPACPGTKSGQPHDGEALELQIRVPTNAKSFSYQENFFTIEFPEFICSEFNDFFVAMLTPQPAGLPDGNIAFDQNNNPISVNNSLLQVCKPQNAGGKNFSCPLGPSTLAMSRFADSPGHAATGWLQTQAPVKPGDTITLRYAIWDSGDGVLDSTVLIDKFQWSVDGATAASTSPAPK
jgi:hypothetical protein